MYDECKLQHENTQQIFSSICTLTRLGSGVTHMVQNFNGETESNVHKFLTHRKKHMKELYGLLYDKYICFNCNTNVRLPTEGDGMCEYSVQLLRMCCL